MSGIVRACVRGCDCARVRVCEGAMRECAMRERAKNHNFLFLAANGRLKKWQPRERAKNHILLFLGDVRVQKSGFFYVEFP